MEESVAVQDTFLHGFLLAERYVGVLELELDGVTFYFVDNEEYFAGFKPYGDMLWDIEKICVLLKGSAQHLTVDRFQTRYHSLP